MRRPSLINLAIRYFTRRGYKVKKDVSQEGLSGLSMKFDLLVQKGKETHPVCVKEWNRTVGVNIVINIDRATQDAGLSNPILIAEKFSEHAKAYANRRGIKLLTRFEMRRGLR